jgi:hypothetical protein
MPFVSDVISRPGIRHQWAGSFRLVSWNVNADALLQKSRMSALLQVVRTEVAADVIFLQEVSSEALIALLEESWIQQNWYISDANASAFGDQKFISIALVSKLWIATNSILLGAIWRISLPRRFGRDALCCDLIPNSSSKHTSGRSSLRIQILTSIWIRCQSTRHSGHINSPSARRTFAQLAAESSPATSSSCSQRTTTLSAPTILPMRGHTFIQTTQVTLGAYTVNSLSHQTGWTKLLCLTLSLQAWASCKRANRDSVTKTPRLF